MADGYWNRQPQQIVPQAGMQKRPRTDYDPPPSGLPAGQLHSYLAREDERRGPQVTKDTKTIGSAYDQYLQNAQNPPFTSSEASNYGGPGLGRAAVSGGMPGFSPADPFPLGRPGARPDFAPNGRGLEFGGRVPMDEMARPAREAMPLPPDASSTLYIEGLPSDSRRREVAHIFRPFVGYKEVRLVSKESKHRGDPLILCFVDFINPACAATALGALQGYKMDEHDPDSPYLRLQFSKNPGPRSGSGPRGRR